MANWDSYVSVATMLFFLFHTSKQGTHMWTHGINLTIRFSEQKLANFRKHVVFKTAQFVVLKLKKKKKKSPGPSSHSGVSSLTRSPFLILNVYFNGPSQSILDAFFFSFSFLLRCASFSFCQPSCIMLLCSPLLQFFLASAIVSEWLCRSLPPWSSLHTPRFCQLIHSVHGLALPDDCWTP